MDAARKALVKQEPKAFFGFSNLSQDDTTYQKYRANCLSALSYKELRAEAERASILDRIAVRTLFARYPKQSLPQIQQHLADGFKSFFDSKLAGYISQFPESTLATSIRGLEDFIRNELSSSGLNSVCLHSGKEDVPLVRRTLDARRIEFSSEILAFIRKFGDWSDRDRVLALYSNHATATSLLTIRGKERISPVAKTLYALGRKRLIDLLKFDADASIRSGIIGCLTQNDVRSLNDALLIEILNDQNYDVRKILALKCSLALPHSRIKIILDRYIKMPASRYYNSIHWLDLGAAMPRSIANQIASFELGKLADS